MLKRCPLNGANIVKMYTLYGANIVKKKIPLGWSLRVLPYMAVPPPPHGGYRVVYGVNVHDMLTLHCIYSFRSRILLIPLKFLSSYCICWKVPKRNTVRLEMFCYLICEFHGLSKNAKLNIRHKFVVLIVFLVKKSKYKKLNIRMILIDCETAKFNSCKIVLQ